ncbi:MAG: hypothetical protein WD768_13135 [Phycisphaeraceae bacterium]
MFGFAHIKLILIIVAAIVLSILREIYHVPIEAVLVFVASGAVLACAWDKLSSITAE